MADLSEFASDLFVILLYLWSMVALFVVAQVIIMIATSGRLMFDSSDDLPAVFTWRRK